METTEPPGAMRYPALAAIAVTSAIVGSIWWQTREEAPQLVATPVSSAAPKAAAPKPPAPLSDRVLAFVAFAKDGLPDDSREATVQGIRLLAAALAARGDSVLWSDRAQRLDEAASRVADAAPELAAREAHEALGQAAEWVAALPRVRFDRKALGAAAESIVPGQPLRDQREKVATFFSAAARALAGDKA